ncbi:hypothetical protein [Acetobacteroides hydrogenigenes]|uniref:Tetratricopeptide repeat protein n=1 Tax=Acetobacteroides hydrogenigenes TaxID=979970 RepID=A0A4R2EQB1_9BACT|nr:hypothetical protein [Acetobacteroides hydrogenigenes]TCN70567.1 hypothetical protein CLV25_10383 [Acetobacteroides hydrogenigenes]
MNAKRFFSVIIALVAMVGAYAQDYSADVDTLVQRMNKDQKNVNYSLYASQFKSLAQTEPNRWEASYYMAYCKIMQAFSLKGEQIDALLDEVDPVLAQLQKANPNESEILVLAAMSSQARISVSPMSRGMKYTQIATELLEKAIAMNPENPRAYMLKAMGIAHTPAVFGGGKDKAKPLFELAKQKFTSFKAPSSIYPTWGYEMNEGMLAYCNK